MKQIQNRPPLFSFPMFFLAVFFFGFPEIASAFLFSAFLFLVLLQKRSPLKIHSIPAPYVLTRLGTVSWPLGNSCEASNCRLDRGILCVLVQCDYRAWRAIRAFNSRGMRFSTFLRYRFLAGYRYLPQVTEMTSGTCSLPWCAFAF